MKKFDSFLKVAFRKECLNLVIKSMKSLNIVSINSMIGMISCFLALVFMSHFLDDHHHIDLANMTLPSILAFACTVLYLRKRAP